MEFLNEEEIQEFTEAFKVFDITGKGLITRSDLEIVMKATGQNPTAEEIEVSHDIFDLSNVMI
jgi:calmodulin